MPDALQIGFAALNRNLDEARRWDPEYRLLAERMASAAAVKHVEHLHEDVEQSADAARARLDNPPGGDERSRQRKGRDHPASREEHFDATPEQEEGHLLDIKA
ncbi:MAG: hypothetical protein HY900_10695 [Deltaproteobacteria bacterium]|nr:hypothetical protein [Deltaproteobacteria bacterium]